MSAPTMKAPDSNDIKDYPDADLLFPKKYTTTALFEAAGRPIALTLLRIEPRHEMKGNGGRSERVPVMFFRETPKGMKLNKTNTKRLKKVLGADPRKWIGKKIVFHVESLDRTIGGYSTGTRVDEQATAKANGGKPAAAPEPLAEEWQDTGDADPSVDEQALSDAAETERQQ